MALKYGLYPYGINNNNISSFEIYDVENQYAYPTEIDTLITDGVGQTQPIFSKWIPAIIVWRDPLSNGHENIINNAWDDWDTANPSNTKPVDMQVIFTEAAFDLIFEQVNTKIAALIAALP